MILRILDLRITQNGLRNPAQLDRMVRFVKEGGVFNKLAMKKFQADNPTEHTGPVIQIARFEDGALYIADGHHRAMAIYEAGRNYLEYSEYQIVDWKYSDYTEINFENRWVTPFDPRSEARYPDYSVFKKAVNEALAISKDNAIDFIRANKALYATQKKSHSILTIFEDLERLNYQDPLPLDCYQR